MVGFEKWFVDFVKWMERLLFYLVFVFFALLVVTQVLMTNTNIRYYLSKVEQLEGVSIFASGEIPEDIKKPLHENVLSEQRYSLTLKILDMVEGTELKILLNGEKAAFLAEERLVLNVQPGDLIEVSGFVPGSEPAAVVIVDANGLKSPARGDTIHTFGDYDLVGWAIPE